MEESPKITIYEVAAQAGVSISTVSKVLSNTARVNNTTREKVLKAVELLNYVPSLAAKGIANGRTSIIGCVVPFTPSQLLNDPHLQGNICGIQEALNARDYSLLPATASQEHSPSSSYERLLRSRYIDGAIVMETQESKSLNLHNQLANQRYPWVMLGYPVGMVPCYCVHADDLQGAQRMTEHLLKLGHTRIGILTVKDGAYAFSERFRGFRQMLNHYKVNFDERMVAYCEDCTTEGAYKVVANLFESPERPTAIFALNDRMALGAVKWTQAHGLRIPDDLTVVGFDDIPLAAVSNPPLTTVKQPSVAMGIEAVNLLFTLIDKGQTVSSRIVVNTELIVRGTSGTVPNRRKTPSNSNKEDTKHS